MDSGPAETFGNTSDPTRRHDTVDSLVIQISLWIDDGGMRARVTSDATGASTVHAAASADEILGIVDFEIRRWTRHFGVIMPATNPQDP